MCTELIYTENHDKPFFGMRVYPVFGGNTSVNNIIQLFMSSIPAPITMSPRSSLFGVDMLHSIVWENINFNPGSMRLQAFGFNGTSIKFILRERKDNDN